jgi:hypothetical protein
MYDIHNIMYDIHNILSIAPQSFFRFFYPFVSFPIFVVHLYDFSQVRNVMFN